MIKRILLIGMLIVILWVFIVAIDDCRNLLSTSSKDYYVANTFSDTGSRNVVTGIYLDYRLFDSLFEAGILLIAVSGIIFIAKSDDSYADKEM